MQYPSEQGVVKKADSSVSYNAECIHCGGTDKIELWPHRNGQGGMIGFIFACAACKDIVQGVRLDISGIRGHQEPDRVSDSEGV